MFSHRRKIMPQWDGQWTPRETDCEHSAQGQTQTRTQEPSQALISRYDISLRQWVPPIPGMACILCSVAFLGRVAPAVWPAHASTTHHPLFALCQFGRRSSTPLGLRPNRSSSGLARAVCYGPEADEPRVPDMTSYADSHPCRRRAAGPPMCCVRSGRAEHPLDQTLRLKIGGQIVRLLPPPSRTTPRSSGCLNFRPKSVCIAWG
jgi:hypothetical protein